MVWQDNHTLYYYLYCLQHPQSFLSPERNLLPQHTQQYDILNTLYTQLNLQYEILCDDDTNIPKDILLFAQIINRIASATCQEWLKDGGILISHSLTLTPLRKLWIAWQPSKKH